MGKRRTERVEGSDPAIGGLRHALPADEIDLHGDRTETARRRLRAFLQRTGRRHPGRAVRVITGKGLHSPDGPRLRPMVLRELRRSDHLVSDWEVSPDRGSVMVRLR